MNAAPSMPAAPPPLPLPARLVLGLLIFAVALEMATRMPQDMREGVLGKLMLALFARPLQPYGVARAFALQHPGLVASGTATLTFSGLLLYRGVLLFWNNQVAARLSGTRFTPVNHAFPMRKVDVLNEIGRRPPGQQFVGLTPSTGLLGRRWRPVYLPERQRSMHRQVLGRTGSGKTLSVLWPQVLQDALDGKGILVMDAKGSNENIRTLKGIAAIAGRRHQLRVFSLPAWSEPDLFSHAYNMLYVKPRTPKSRGDNAEAMASRVFAVLRETALGDNVFYNVQAEHAFVRVCQLLHGMVGQNGNEAGHGLPFTMRDVATCLKGIGPGGCEDGFWGRALAHCLVESKDREASHELEAHIKRLGRDVHQTLSGLIGAVDKFQSPLVNAYAPDIVFEEALEQNLIVYAQLPANLLPLQAPVMGKVMLKDVQQSGSMRQVFRERRNQRPFAVTIDEFYSFADVPIIDSLNKLRDANVQYTLCHQSLADVQMVSPEFAQSVWDNTRTKDILSQDNPALCDQLAKSIGTKEEPEKTVRVQRGALFTSINSGDASTKMVDKYRLHPNAIRGLAPAGQGYLYSPEGVHGLSYGMLPESVSADYAMPRNDQKNARGLRLYERFVGATDPPAGHVDGAG